MKPNRSKRLNRRSFIKTTGAGLAGLTLLPDLSNSLFAQRQQLHNAESFRSITNGFSATRSLQMVTLRHLTIASLLK